MLPKQAQHFYFGDCVAHQRKYLWNVLKFILKKIENKLDNSLHYQTRKQ